MATKRTSQTQQEPSTSPFGNLPGAELWLSTWDGHRERFEQMMTEMERMESERHTRTLGAIDDLATLLKSSMEYQRQLTAQWRTMTLETARQGAGMLNGKS